MGAPGTHAHLTVTIVHYAELHIIMSPCLACGPLSNVPSSNVSGLYIIIAATPRATPRVVEY